MKLRDICRFEFLYQARQGSTWLSFALLLVFSSWMMIVSKPSDDDRFLNSPYDIAFLAALGGIVWLLMAPSIAGEAAARDTQTRMNSLMYAAPVSKAEYLGGRFLAAVALNALILLALPAGLLLGQLSPTIEAGRLDQFRFATYATTHAVITLPFAFVCTAIQFASAALSRRTMASYLASVIIFISSTFVLVMVAQLLGRRELVAVLDLIGSGIITGDLGKAWPAVERNTRLLALEHTVLVNRTIWLALAGGALAFMYRRFKLAHPENGQWLPILNRRNKRPAERANTDASRGARMIFSRVLPPFGFATYARQTLSIAVDSCQATAKSRAGLVLVVFIPISVAAVLPQYMENFGVPLFPRTEYILAFLTAPLTNPFTPWVIVPLLIILIAGELVWRERDAGLAEITDSAPVPESAVLLGKLLGLSFLLGALMAHLIAAGVLVQAFMGHFDFDLGLYARVLFGLQLPEYLLFAVTAVAMHGMVNHKHIAHLVILGAYAFIAFASNFGVEHDLFIYGASPAWSYTAMSGFGRSVEPWLWFKLYWTGWAILLGVAARLLWVRGVGKGARIRSAGRRFTRPTAGAAATAVGLVLGCGGYILYQTDRLNPQIIGVSEERQWRADYERHYSQYTDIPLPDLASGTLNVDIEPEEGALKVRGSYHLVNRGAEAIDSIHLSTHHESTTAFTLEPAGTPVLSDADLGYSIHALAKPLQPGESLRLFFELSVDSPGFRTDEIGASVVPNGTFVRFAPLLPALGYQPGRELRKAADRRAQGLPPRAEFAPLSDSAGHDELIARNPARFDFVIRTAADQIAVAPGQLLETWTEKGRRCFRYAAETPVDAVFSAKYSVLEAQWNDIPIQIFHHPSHTANLELMIRSVRASLDHYSEQFGPYPHRHISLVERPGIGGMHADPGLISFQAGYSMFNLDGGAHLPIFPFAVVAHEVAHQWWGSHLYDGRRVEGNPLLSESLAEYSAFQVLRKTCGQENLRRYLRGLRARYRVGGKRAAVPLLRATDKYHQYFKGPIALHAISELIGQEPVNLALRRLLEAHASGAILTTLDLYRQLRTVTPGSLQYLLHDLFQANTSWEFETEEAAARQVNAAEWQVTLTVRARKVVLDETGRETEIPMDEPIQVGVFGPSEPGGSSTQPLYLQMHSIRSGEQKITVTVPRKPVQAGIDPYHLLDWVEDGDNSNIEPIQIEESAAR